MDGKYIALIALAAGISFLVAGFSTMGEGATGLDRLPLTILLILIGAGLVIGSIIAFAVRLFMVL